MKTSSILPSARAWCLRTVLSGILSASSSAAAHEGRGEAPVAGAVTQEIIDVVAVLNALRAAVGPRELTDYH